MKHRAYRSRRTPQRQRDFLERVRGDQVQKFLLFWLGPWPIAALGLDSRLPDKSPASGSWISRRRSYPRDKCFQSDRRGWPSACRFREVQISGYDFSCSARPAKGAALYLSAQIIHVALNCGKRTPHSLLSIHGCQRRMYLAGNEHLSAGGPNRCNPQRFPSTEIKDRGILLEAKRHGTCFYSNAHLWTWKKI